MTCARLQIIAIRANYLGNRSLYPLCTNILPPFGLIQYTLDGPLYISRGHGLKLPNKIVLHL